MPIPAVTRILVADDHSIVRSGLKRVLDAQPDLSRLAMECDWNREQGRWVKR